MKKFVCVLLLVCMCLSLVACISKEKPDRVHIYGDVILGTEYVKGYVCFKIADYNFDTKQVKIRGLEQYGWITVYNGDFYMSNERCSHCGYKYANIT